MQPSPLEAAARAGGDVLRRYFGQALDVATKKTPADLRTAADTEAEAAVLAVLRAAEPDATVIAEETGRIEGTSDVTYVVDPLDGSNNFVLGFPYFSVAAARLEGNATTEAVVHNPILGATWRAAQGKTARDGEAVSVNAVGDLARVTLAHVANYGTWPAQVREALGLVQTLGLKRLLNSWSPALDFCLLAEGKIEAVFCDVTDENEFHDFAVGKHLARCAGARITRLDGSPDGDPFGGVFLATNGTAIHERLLEAVKQARA